MAGKSIQTGENIIMTSDKTICDYCGRNATDCAITEKGEIIYLGWRKIHGQDYCPECAAELGLTNHDMICENIFDGFEMQYTKPKSTENIFDAFGM